MRFTEEEARFFSQSLDDDPNICDEGFLLRRDQNAKDARKAQTKLRCRMPSLSLIDQEKRSPELESQSNRIAFSRIEPSGRKPVAQRLNDLMHLNEPGKDQLSKRG